MNDFNSYQPEYNTGTPNTADNTAQNAAAGAAENAAAVSAAAGQSYTAGQNSTAADNSGVSGTVQTGASADTAAGQSYTAGQNSATGQNTAAADNSGVSGTVQTGASADTAAGQSYTAGQNYTAGQSTAAGQSGPAYRSGPAYAQHGQAANGWSYNYQNTAAKPPRPPKKASHVGLAILVIVCMLLSGAAGYFGSRLAVQQSASSGSASLALSGESSSSSEKASLTVAQIKSEDGLTSAQLAAQVSPTVVQVTTEYTTTNYWMQETVATGSGSGVILSSDGYIITNNHVVEDATDIHVTLSDGTEYPATLVGTDEQTDIAVIKIDATGLTAAAVGDSDQLAVGQEVVAVGNPLGELTGTVTNGIISALNREVTVENNTMTLIQTNAAINAGNSGGGLFDANGNLIGIVNAKYSSTGVEGLGFAIPINVAMDTAKDLMQYGYVTGRINVGLNLLEISDAQTAMQYRVSDLGVYVYSVTDGSSASNAGFKTGDYIVSVDGTAVSTVNDVKTIFNQHAIGDTVTVHVKRNGQESDLSLILTEYVPSKTTNVNK